MAVFSFFLQHRRGDIEIGIGSVRFKPGSLSLFKVIMPGPTTSFSPFRSCDPSQECRRAPTHVFITSFDPFPSFSPNLFLPSFNYLGPRGRSENRIRKEKEQYNVRRSNNFFLFLGKLPSCVVVPPLPLPLIITLLLLCYTTTNSAFAAAVPGREKDLICSIYRELEGEEKPLN